VRADDYFGKPVPKLLPLVGGGGIGEPPPFTGGMEPKSPWPPGVVVGKLPTLPGGRPWTLPVVPGVYGVLVLKPLAPVAPVGVNVPVLGPETFVGPKPFCGMVAVVTPELVPVGKFGAGMDCLAVAGGFVVNGPGLRCG
jgi:hypothetical protein